jgi:beta-lactamase regulating signal transducer with metallopeptidase domain
VSLPDLDRALGAWLAPLLVQFTVLAVLVLALDRLLARTRLATLAYGLWCLLPLKVLLPPDLVSPLGLGLPTPAGGAIEGGLGGTGPAGPSVLLLLWAAGTLVLLVRLVLRRRATRRWLHRHARPAPAGVRGELRHAARRLGLARVPRVIEHPAFCGPAVVGALRPVVVLPSSGLGEGAREHALLHEVAHVKRRDLWSALAFDLLAVLLWFHPLAWVARRRAHALREVCCDLTVAAALGDRAEAYRDALLRLAAARHLRGPLPAGGAAWIAPGSTLLLRLEALAAPRRKAALRSRRLGLALVVLLGAVLLPLSSEAAPGGCESDVAAARVLLERTFAERDRYGCFHRRYAWACYEQAVAGGPDTR